MTQILVITLLVAGGAVLSILKPILLPALWVTSITDLLSSVWVWEGILPIEAIVNCLFFDFVFVSLWLVFKLLFGTIAGKPELN